MFCLRLNYTNDWDKTFTFKTIMDSCYILGPVPQIWYGCEFSPLNESTFCLFESVNRCIIVIPFFLVKTSYYSRATTEIERYTCHNRKWVHLQHNRRELWLNKQLQSCVSNNKEGIQPLSYVCVTKYSIQIDRVFLSNFVNVR